jgi:hypothetical protein
MQLPMVRKYAFHMILAGHRFGKAGQVLHKVHLNDLLNNNFISSGVML